LVNGAFDHAKNGHKFPSFSHSFYHFLSFITDLTTHKTPTDRSLHVYTHFINIVERISSSFEALLESVVSEHTTSPPAKIKKTNEGEKRVVTNAEKGLQVCGAKNKFLQPCQRVGVCPFHQDRGPNPKTRKRNKTTSSTVSETRTISSHSSPPTQERTNNISLNIEDTHTKVRVDSSGNII
jgi:hypothetical protein